MSSSRPYHRHLAPSGPAVVRNHSDTASVDLRYVHLPPYGAGYTVAEAVKRFDARTAEFVRAGTGTPTSIVVGPVDVPSDLGSRRSLSLLSTHDKTATGVPFPSTLCLAALAYVEYFPWDRGGDRLGELVSEAIVQAYPQWCGSFGAPSSTAALVDLADSGLSWAGLGAPLAFFADLVRVADGGEGNYDLDQMPLLTIAYRYYDRLTPAAQDRLVEVLLATGRINRPNIDSGRVTSGGVPQDWGLAGEFTVLGVVFKVRETENHILQIHTARYLTNQLLYQRDGPDHDPDRDNRRNGQDGGPSCTELMLDLLQNFLKDDFSEYNAKSYQTETRNALRNLCSYAYDHEVRLAARMVLDYLSARVAVSSCDLRRLVPFRRRNEGANVATIGGVMDVGLLEWASGADPAVEPFVVLTGNTRAFETCPLLPNGLPPISSPVADSYNLGPVKSPTVYRVAPWSIRGFGDDGLLEGLGDYRIPAAIHDLFVTDAHRRYLQYLHRTATDDVRTGQNADNYEIYAGSPSYLISAGGSPAGPALDPGPAGWIDPDAIIHPSHTEPDVLRQQRGVAVTTSFMPTGQSAGPNTQNYAADVIQFGSFQDRDPVPAGHQNYGVAPDFACGYSVYLPAWATAAIDHRYDRRSNNDKGSFSFIDRKHPDGPGFYLAIYQDDVHGFAVMEAFDTWLHRDLDFPCFASHAFTRNADIDLGTSPFRWWMTSGESIDFTIYSSGWTAGAAVLNPQYLLTNHADFLSGTVLNSSGNGVITISNPGTQQTIVLDMSDTWHPVRTSETGQVERGGGNTEVWVDFDYHGLQEGDFFHPFNTMSAALAAVADHGVIKVMPGRSPERPVLGGKAVRIEAAIGGVRIGS